MAEKPSPKYPEKTLVQFKHGHDLYIGQIIKSEIVQAGHRGRKAGSILYLVRILSINRQKTTDCLQSTIGEDEIISHKKPT